MHLSGLLLLLSVVSCAPAADPNANAYNWHLPSPDPVGRSFQGYDPLYEQYLLDRYVATHGEEVRRFRLEQGW